MVTKTKINKNKIEKIIRSISINEIYKIIVNTVVNRDVSKYYLDSFVYKIFCKHALFFASKEDYKEIAQTGGFTGLNYKSHVLRACSVHDRFVKNHQEFKEISNECFELIDSSNKAQRIEDLSFMKKEIIESVRDKIKFFSDEEIRELILNINNGN
tara:strand:- start:185 stop:652 length:468 start_codon:yes stop_codon:yes gene_type:complete